VYSVASGDNVSIYIDGVLDTASANGNTWVWTTGQELEFGLSHDAQYQAYSGLLDDVRIYNQALSDADVTSVFTKGAPADNTSLVLELLFNTAPVAGVSFSWHCPDAILQSANSLTEPFVDVTYPVSTLNVLLPAASNKFYRYRASHTPQTIITNPYRM
jgi:hypothetical protein